jgi:lipopolysaccharide transport system permease protein
MGTVSSSEVQTPGRLRTLTEADADAPGPTPPTGLAGVELPSEPVVVIEPTRAWVGLNLKDIWNHRELLYFLAWRDMKVRYKQTALGVLWVLLQPLLMTLIFTVFLGKLAKVPSDGRPYSLIVYIGLLPWTFFSSALLSGVASLVANANVITKVYFPRILIPAAAVVARLLDFLIGFVILVGMMIYYHVAPTPNLLLLPVLIVITTFLALSLGMLAASLNVRYRDVGVILPVIVQLWMFISPVLYPLSIVPPQYRYIYQLNPLAGIVEGFRVAILGGTIDFKALGITAIVTAVLLVYSAFTFRRFERSFADRI